MTTPASPAHSAPPSLAPVLDVPRRSCLVEAMIPARASLAHSGVPLAAAAADAATLRRALSAGPDAAALLWQLPPVPAPTPTPAAMPARMPAPADATPPATPDPTTGSPTKRAAKYARKRASSLGSSAAARVGACESPYLAAAVAARRRRLARAPVPAPADTSRWSQDSSVGASFDLDTALAACGAASVAHCADYSFEALSSSSFGSFGAGRGREPTPVRSASLGSFGSLVAFSSGWSLADSDGPYGGIERSVAYASSPLLAYAANGDLRLSAALTGSASDGSLYSRSSNTAEAGDDGPRLSVVLDSSASDSSLYACWSEAADVFNADENRPGSHIGITSSSPLGKRSNSTRFVSTDARKASTTPVLPLAAAVSKTWPPARNCSPADAAAAAAAHRKRAGMHRAVSRVRRHPSHTPTPALVSRSPPPSRIPLRAGVVASPRGRARPDVLHGPSGVGRGVGRSAGLPVRRPTGRTAVALDKSRVADLVYLFGRA